MLELDLQALLLGNARHMHQARAVGACHVFSTGLDMPLHLVFSHLCRDGGLLNGEHSSEATAFVGTLGLDDLNAFYELQQVFDLVELAHMLLTGGGET